MAPIPIYIFLGIMLSLVIFWFVYISKVFNYLAINHPKSFEDIGSPHVFSNNTPQNGINSLRFLLGSGHKKLNDPDLNTKCANLKKVFFIYSILLSLPIILVLISANS